MPRLKCALAILLIGILTQQNAHSSNAVDASKYQIGDCITPIDKEYSWFGKVARVEAISKIDGFSGINYVLTFPKSISNSNIFGKEIEQKTEIVDNERCKP